MPVSLFMSDFLVIGQSFSQRMAESGDEPCVSADSAEHTEDFDAPVLLEHIIERSGEGIGPQLMHFSLENSNELFDSAREKQVNGQTTCKAIVLSINVALSVRGIDGVIVRSSQNRTLLYFRPIDTNDDRLCIAWFTPYLWPDTCSGRDTCPVSKVRLETVARGLFTPFCVFGRSPHMA
jgi:hypothetical protein